MHIIHLQLFSYNSLCTPTPSLVGSPKVSIGKRRLNSEPLVLGWACQGQTRAWRTGWSTFKSKGSGSRPRSSSHYRRSVSIWKARTNSQNTGVQRDGQAPLATNWLWWEYPGRGSRSSAEMCQSRTGTWSGGTTALGGKGKESQDTAGVTGYSPGP